MTLRATDRLSLEALGRIDGEKYQDEREAVAGLLARTPLDTEARRRIAAEAADLVRGARAASTRNGVVESFLQEFSLGTREGLALMCLAEALLRTPDDETRDRLIAEKIGSADWASHAGQSDSVFVNASTWGLMLTGKLVEVDDDARRDLPGFLKRLAGRLGEPVIRRAVASAVRIMGEQFVLGQTIDAALARAKREGFLCSFDMLGEGARTAADAARYERIYAEAIARVGERRGAAGPEDGHGVSVKLSALSPRYEATQEARAFEELYPRVLRLALIARQYDMNYAIDAEEADRLVLSLKLIERLAAEPALGNWTGLGVVVQAYQKRSPRVIAHVADLARRTGRRLMVRLVKGAYWDAEIKRAQVMGRPDYPVWTTKPATDLAYLVCARALIDAAPHLYAQFATHNAHTLAAVRHMADAAGVRIEHQRLHGMGETLYQAAATCYGPITVRAYAPVGGHEDLLPYLVRRLLENGANTSFVHALTDERVPAERVAADPITTVEAQPDRHPRLPIPRDIYGPSRRNSEGDDMSLEVDRARLVAAASTLSGQPLEAGPILGGRPVETAARVAVRSPNARGRIVGHVRDACADDIDQAFARARKAQPGWDRLGGTETAWAINRTLAARRGPIVPFIAETGGLNGMFVDTSALREQVIDDVIVSAFGSAGQRCSALRLLFLPHDTADTVIEGLRGAMDALVVGNPADPATDVGPVIDEDALAALQAHATRLQGEATHLHRTAAHGPADGLYFPPLLAEIPSLDLIEREVFGPILHVLRYDPEHMEATAAALADKGYGLTLGIHSRLDSFAEKVQRLVPAGNVYVNRSIIGAVVGVQPFGGEGLSGTGPKAGGPYALVRYASERAVSVNIAAQGGDPALLNL